MVRPIVIGMLATSAFVAQAVPSADLGIVSQAERITLVGALIIAVGVLWRTMSRKDEQLVKCTEAMTAALITSAEAAKASVATDKELKAAIYALRDGLGELPCTRMDQPDGHRRAMVAGGGGD